MKKIFLLIVLVAQSAIAGYVDLSQYPVKYSTPCHNDKGEKFLCVVKEKDGVKYLIIYDRKGEYEIYSDEKLLWIRKSI